MRFVKNISLYLLLVFSIFPQSEVDILKGKINKLIKHIGKNYKIYYCDDCPAKKPEILILRSYQFRSYYESDELKLKFTINGNRDLDPSKVYIPSNNKWINAGILSDFSSKLPEELPGDLYPEDPEDLINKDIQTKGEIEYLNILENKLYNDINLLRTNPSEFSKKIDLILPNLKGNEFHAPGRMPYSIKGNKNSFIQLQKKLNSLETINELKIDKKLSEGVSKNRLVRTGSIPETYSPYIEKPEHLYVYEIYTKGWEVSHEIISNLLVSRWNEYSKYLFDPDFEYIGLSCGKENNITSCKFLLASTLTIPDDLRQNLKDYETKSDYDFLTKFEKDVIEETNLLRTNPKKYSEFLRARKKYYKGNLLKFPKLAPLQRKEGLKAVDEAINVLENLEPLPPMKINENLSISSQDHVKDSGPKNSRGHTGSDGSSPMKRILRHIKKLKTGGENIAYGYFSARNIVIELFIDDGVYDRGHRKNLLNSEFNHIGVSCGPHKTYKIMCVQNFGGW